MIIPSFLNETLLNSVSLISIDLENSIKSLGLNILNYGVIDKDTDKMELLVQNDREFLQEGIRKYLMSKPMHVIVHVFWSNLSKYSILCNIKFVLDNLDNIFDEDWDFWIISTNKEWLIENYHEEELSIFLLN
ncbi:hypothetical protein [Acinetobacter sp. ABJ_C5_2]|uniref:hypothetical protein n=1 Tax=Acinetobacter sp. ABJ_C5_2 TaxID=3376992 RepID=UPI0037C554C2